MYTQYIYIVYPSHPNIATPHGIPCQYCRTALLQNLVCLNNVIFCYLKEVRTNEWKCSAKATFLPDSCFSQLESVELRGNIEESGCGLLCLHKPGRCGDFLSFTKTIQSWTKWPVQSWNTCWANRRLKPCSMKQFGTRRIKFDSKEKHCPGAYWFQIGGGQYT